MKIIIIEDENLSAEHLASLLKRINTNIEIVAQFDSVKSTLRNLDNYDGVDLIFMDIHLADGISFEIFEKKEISTPIIFTTAFNEYAIKAFKVNSIDYLLKPITKKDLEDALYKFKTLNQKKPVFSTKELANLLKLPEKEYKQRFLVKLGDQLFSVNTSDIFYFCSEDGCVVAVTKNGKRHLVDFNLDELENLIDPLQFFRINRKVLVNISLIEKVNSYFNSRLKIMSNLLTEDMAIVSRERVTDFKKWLDK